MTRKRNKKRDVPSSTMSETTVLSVEEILERGDSAARLLNEPIFSIAYEETVQNIQDDWIRTLPHESQKREGMYQKVIALSEVANELAAMVQATQGINMESMKKELIDPTFQ